MSEDITKKQHYVWRRYLAAWKNDSGDKDVWTCILTKKRRDRQFWVHGSWLMING